MVRQLLAWPKWRAKQRELGRKSCTPQEFGTETDLEKIGDATVRFVHGTKHTEYGSPTGTAFSPRDSSWAESRQRKTAAQTYLIEARSKHAWKVVVVMDMGGGTKANQRTTSAQKRVCDSKEWYGTRPGPRKDAHKEKTK